MALTGFSFGMAALWVLAASVALYTIFFSSLHEIDVVRVSGASDLGNERLESEVKQFISQKIFSVFPGNNYFLFSGPRLTRDLLERFPKLASVRVEEHFPHSIEVFVVERERIFLWCSGGTCFLVDDRGCARDARYAEQELNNPFLVRITDESALPLSAGECPIPSDLRDVVLRLERGLRTEAGLALRLPAYTPSRISREIRFRTEEGWEVWMSADILPEKSLTILRTVLDAEIPPESRTKLRYIDLRTENKAFYSLIQETPPVEEGEQEEKGEPEKKE